MEQRSKPDPADASDLELAAMVAAGDGAAFEVLMRRYNQVLYRLARSIVKDDTEAEDVVQEAYLLAWRNAGSFRGDASLATWLTRIVVNEASGRLRKTRRRADIIELVPGAAGSDDLAEDAMLEPEHGAAPDAPETAALRAEARRLIEARIDALPDSLRTVFVLRAIEDLSVQETAAALGMLEATVRSQYFRARGLLREALARDFDIGVASAFSFDGERCDRIVARVLARLRSIGLLRPQKLSTKRAPPATERTWRTVPPFACTSWRTSARPMPRPPFLVVKKGVKMCASRSSGTPGPLSLTSIRRRAPRTSRACTVTTRRRHACGGLGGVLQQVDQRLLELARVGHQGQRAGFDQDLEFAAACAPVRPDQRRQARQQARQLDAFGLRLRHRGQAAVAADEIGKAGGAPRDRVERGGEVGAGLAVALRLEFLQQALGRGGKRGDRGQRIHDLVGQHLHQLLPGVQRLGLQFALHGQQRGQALRPALHGERGHRHHRALGAAFGIEGNQGAPAGRLPRQHGVQRRGVDDAPGRDHPARIRVQRGDIVRAAGVLDQEQGDRRVLEARFQHQRGVGLRDDRRRAAAAGTTGAPSRASARHSIHPGAMASKAHSTSRRGDRRLPAQRRPAPSGPGRRQPPAAAVAIEARG